MVLHAFIPMFLSLLCAYVYGMTRHIRCDNWQATGYVIGVRLQVVTCIMVACYLAFWSY